MIVKLPSAGQMPVPASFDSKEADLNGEISVREMLDLYATDPVTFPAMALQVVANHVTGGMAYASQLSVQDIVYLFFLLQTQNNDDYKIATECSCKVGETVVAKVLTKNCQLDTLDDWTPTLLTEDARTYRILPVRIVDFISIWSACAQYKTDGDSGVTYPTWDKDKLSTSLMKFILVHGDFTKIDLDRTPSRIVKTLTADASRVLAFGLFAEGMKCPVCGGPLKREYFHFPTLWRVVRESGL